MRRALMLTALLLLSCAGHAQSWYKVEVLVFAREQGQSEEQWVQDQQPRYASQAINLSNPALSQADPDALAHGAWQALPGDETSLQYMMERMASTGKYRQLYHRAWRQPIGSRQDTRPVYLRGDRTLDLDGEAIPELEGTLQFSQARYLHLDPRIWFNTGSDGQRVYVDIHESRRLQGAEVYYFDHPMFGMLVRVTP